MKIMYLCAVYLLLAMVKSQELCSEQNITVEAFLNEEPFYLKEPSIYINLAEAFTGSVYVNYIAWPDCRKPSSSTRHLFANNSRQLFMESDSMSQVKLILGCPYKLTLWAADKLFLMCNFTIPQNASTADGSITHIRNNSFYPTPLVSVDELPEGFAVYWNHTVSESFLPNLNICLDVYDVIQNIKDFISDKCVPAEQQEVFVPVQEVNRTIYMKIYYADNYNRKSRPVSFTVTNSPSVPPDRGIVIALVVAMIVFALPLVALAWYTRWKLLKRQKRLVDANEASWPNERHNPMYFKDNWEVSAPKNIKPCELTLIKHLGEGNFGQVSLMRWKTKDINVAVKTMKHSHELETERLQYHKEIDIFKKVGYHENIVEMFGYNMDEQPWFIVMEYIDLGDLLAYLRKLRDDFEATRQGQCIMDQRDNYITQDDIESYPLNAPVKSILPAKDMESFGRQIAEGMQHLEHCGVVHRDLAARNILLTHNKIIKITDFGLSRESSYINIRRTGALPVKWMAPETCTGETKVGCLSKSDVWSFGVVLWEIGTLGGSPYEGLSFNEISGYLASGRRLARPETVKDSLYNLMMRCWEYDYNKRPTFKEIVQEFENMSTYFELSDLRPDYVFPSYQHYPTANTII